jgi:inorganic pyrophosphatase/exopolyphosphatase
MDNILVTCYIDPDLDGFACSIAYAEFLNHIEKSATPKFFGEPNIEARYLMQKFGFKYPEDVDVADFNKFILVDSSELRDLDKAITPENVIEVIDHRKVNDAAHFKNAKIQIELVGSAATLIAEKFYNAKIDISISAATLLYGAIVSNTLNFRAKITTDRDRRMAEWLNHKLKLAQSFVDDMFRAKSDLSGDTLTARIEGDFAWFNMGKQKIGFGQLEVMNVKELIRNRKMDILAVLEKLKSELALDQIFISLIDLGEGFDAFIARDPRTQNLLTKTLGVKFKDCVAIHDGFIMRKEIVPLLKKILEKEE